jgi:hypothetical protein
MLLDVADDEVIGGTTGSRDLISGAIVSDDLPVEGPLPPLFPDNVLDMTGGGALKVPVWVTRLASCSSPSSTGYPITILLAFRNEEELFIIRALLISLLDDSRLERGWSPDDSDVEDPWTFGFLGCNGNRGLLDIDSDPMFRWTFTVMQFDQDAFQQSN